MEKKNETGGSLSSLTIKVLSYSLQATVVIIGFFITMLLSDIKKNTEKLDVISDKLDSTAVHIRQHDFILSDHERVLTDHEKRITYTENEIRELSHRK